ncbi:MAG: hypothetical protein P8L18_14570 [Verrucomicrobiota bacterium]|jgi:hypothetical protein|nr:hypothetical protein [Verrucomicrobiota bacterium]
MEFNWDNTLAVTSESAFVSRDIEESFEDPFAIKLLPDASRFSAQARFFNLGRSATGLGIFSVYRTNGKQVRVILSRPFTEDESYFYQRKFNQVVG